MARRFKTSSEFGSFRDHHDVGYQSDSECYACGRRGATKHSGSAGAPVRIPFRPTHDDVLALIEAAILAPSADNRHRFRFAIRPDGLDIIADDFFVRCDESHRRLLILIAYGAAVENLRLKLTQRGWTFRPHWFPDAADASMLLRLRWDALEAIGEPDPLANRIASRHTNRRLYRREPASATALRALADAAEATEGVSLQWFDGASRRRALLRMIRFAEGARFQSPSLHAELFESIDFRAGWQRIAPEDLSPATLEVEPFLRPMFAALRHPGVMRLARSVGTHHLLGLRAGYLPAATAPHLGALVSHLPPEEAALAVGRAFQRLWLAADAAGLALQPMVASAILAWQEPGKDPARVLLHRRLRAEWAILLDSPPPLVVFRLGHARPPTAVSGRQPVVHYLCRSPPNGRDRSSGR
jgi:nitroreductase